MTQKITIIKLLCLLLFLQQITIVPVSAAARVFLCSRLEFTPALLDMLRRSVGRTLGINDAVILQPLQDTASLAREASGSLILIEHGMDISFLPHGYQVSATHIDLVWVLVASMRVPGLPITSSLGGEEFATLLHELKEQSPDCYPWFESLSSRVTLRNFDILFKYALAQDTALTPATASSAAKPFWQQSDSIISLYRAIEEHLLNPFSIEADLGLAMNVFEAGDAMFVSQWVPAEFLDDDRLCRENMGKVRLLPFPLLNNQKYLRIRLCLCTSEQVDQNTPAADAHPPDERFIDLDYIADMEWIEKMAADRYDALIMGGF